jgi:2,4-dienoyl-CoA reductase (NADPH2)
MAYRLFLPELPDKAIADGILDIWEMCRPMIADPLMPLKALEGREAEVRPCVACNMCLARLFRDAPMTCYVNPVCAHEADTDWQITPAATPKNVMVIGGGPSGLECAYVAAQRGHDVHVYDSNETLGGQVIPAAKAPYGDEELYGMIDYHKAMCEKTGVKFHLGTTVTSELIDDELPDAVVLATGAEFVKGDAAGFDGPNIVCATDVLDGKAEVGEKVVVWGGKKPGIGVALYLAERGKKVTLVSRERKVGKDVNPSYIWRYIKKLNQKRVKTYKECDIEEITGTGVVVKNHYGTRIPVSADTVIYAEREPRQQLKAAIKEQNIELHVIGDALVPRALSNALHDGYRTGIRL